jgi:type IV secretory pathway TraG/TraD family ATPase VirD4
LNDDPRSEIHFLYAALVAIGCRLLWLGWIWFQAFIKSPIHVALVSVVIASVIAVFFRSFAKKRMKKKNLELIEKAILGPAEGAVFCGHTDKKEKVFIKTKQRSMHTQVIGTTNAGKTESVILPWAIQDIQQGRGLILIDGKADNSLLEKLWGYAKLAGREKDFRLFSLSHLDASYPFNPLLGGSAEEITERVFNAFEFENPYYRSLQYEVMGQIMRILEANGTTPTFQRINQLMTDMPTLQMQVDQVEDVNLRQWVQKFKLLSNSDRDMRTSGLLSALGQFAHGKTGCLFNTDENAINLDEVLSKNQIVYFQLPVLLSPFLGKATGKLILQSLQAAVANRHRGRDKEKRFFSVFLDDFSEYLYPGFVSILNKSRSANVGIVFAHQALGDIQTLGEPIANSILTNSNLKVFMRGNDPESAEYFSKVIGTEKGTKFTERQKKGLFNHMEKSGDMSVREVEEFSVHPNSFKRELGVGQAMMLIPHDGGMKTIKIKFDRYPDVEAQEIPSIKKSVLGLLEVPQAVPSKPEDETSPKKLKKTKSVNAAKIKNAA